MLKMMTAALLASLLAGTACAATDWTFRDITFTAREGWCPAPAAEGNPPALEIRPCEQDFPYLSATPGEEGPPRQDLARLAAAEAAKAATEEGKNRVLAVIVARHGGDCVENSYKVDSAPMPGVPAFSVTASFICDGDEEEPVLFDVFTAYAQRRDGTIWTIAFDHPGGPISPNDRTMIRAAITKISGR